MGGNGAQNDVSQYPSCVVVVLQRDHKSDQARYVIAKCRGNDFELIRSPAAVDVRLVAKDVCDTM